MTLSGRIYDCIDGDVKWQVEDMRPVAKEWNYSESEVDRIEKFQIRVGSQS